MADIRIKASQVTPAAIGEADLGYAQGTKQGAIYGADWIEQAIRAGKGWSITVGSMTAGFGPALITGGGAGTCIDQDQPEIAIGLSSGWLVPIRIMVACHIDIDAADDDADIIATVDTALNGVSTAPTGTAETPDNMLDGAGGSCSANCYSAITTDITDPTVSQILDYCNIVSDAVNVDTHQLKMDYAPKYPRRFAGPCALYVYWGGVAATAAIATVEFLVLDTSWLPIS